MKVWKSRMEQPINQSLITLEETAAAKTGVKDRLFKRHGSWRSENAKDRYVKDNLKELLSVSRNLDI